MSTLRTLLASACVLGLAAPVMAKDMPSRFAPAIGFHVRPSPKEIAVVKSAGFDFLEVALGPVAKMTPEEVQRFREDMRRLGLPIRAANMDMSAKIKQVGPDVDQAKLDEHVQLFLDRAAALGIKTVLLGGAGARKIPDGFPKDKAFAQYVALGKRVAAEADKRGLTVALEPLRREVTNFVNTVPEALAVVRAVNHERFKLSVDVYQMTLEKEPPSILLSAGKELAHVQLSNPNGRSAPLADGEYDYAGLFAVLRRIGYRGVIALELDGKDHAAVKHQETVARSLAYLRGAVARADARRAGP
jgi:D-psicose/D-tagatose/L-ribulose 3-epimerase